VQVPFGKANKVLNAFVVQVITIRNSRSVPEIQSEKHPGGH
jgi:hypothetical protein